MNKSRILFLDYMRIFAFSSVILGHKFYRDLVSVANDASTHITIRYIAQAIYDITVGGAVGVVVFFMISGYIITYVLQSEGTKEFYLKRIFRIYPIYVFAVLTEVVVKYFNGIDIPPLSVLVPRLLLIGDFFGTPLGLAGVEWTLRIEVMFYVIMGLMKFSGVLSSGRVACTLMVIACFVLMESKVLPTASDFHNGLFSTYLPILFCGVVVFFMEKREISKFMAFLCLSIMLYSHFKILEVASPRWVNSNYAIIGFFIFMTSWAMRDRFSYNYWCVLLSELTYSIYLFHDWIWFYFNKISSAITNNYAMRNAIIIILLLSLCYASNKLIEKRGVKIGRLVISK